MTEMDPLWRASNEALELWIKLTGFNPKSNTLDWNFHELHEAIKEAQELDVTGLTAFMILRNCARTYARSIQFNALQIVEESESIKKQTETLRQLLARLEDPKCFKRVKSWTALVKKAARHMGFGKKMFKIIADHEEMGFIRRDALRAFKELETHHFSVGPRLDHEAHYNRYIHRFWNVNSALVSAKKQKTPGITLVMFHDPVDLYSHFGFLLCNGGNIVLVTDREEQAHPLQKYMSRARSQERRYEDRAYRLRFPYDLFDFTFDDKGYYVRKASESIVPVNYDGLKVKEIKDVEADCAIWSLLMFDLLREKYWRLDPVQPKAISCTAAAMVALPQIQKGPLAIPGARVVEPIYSKDLTKKRMKGNWERKPVGENEWMIARYKDKIPNVALDLVGSNNKLYLPSGKRIERRTLKRYGFYGESEIEPASLDVNNYGSPKQMEKDRVFIARHNQCAYIAHEAQQEFRRRKNKIIKWYNEAVRKNINTLLEAALRGELFSTGLCHTEKAFTLKREKINMVSQFFEETIRPYPLYSCLRPTAALFKDGDDEKYPRCYITGKHARVWTTFTPWESAGLASLTGVETSALPDVLQRWSKREQYIGNSILDRLDPAEWVITNPWRSITFDVTLGLSWQFFKKQLKEKGIQHPKIRHTNARKERQETRGY